MKKSQVTLFIIAGILIIVIIGLFVAFMNRTQESRPTPPQDIAPIVKYTEGCIEQTAQSGILLLKMQGGYINIPERLQRSQAYIDYGFQVPFWYYDRMDYMPTRMRMQNELAGYIDKNLDNCLNSYEQFNKYEIDVEMPKSEVIIEDNIIRVSTDYSIKAKEIGKDTSYKWDDFRVEMEDSLGRLHSLAKDIIEYENTEFFLEDYTDEMIASSDYLPFEGMLLDCSPKIYLQSELKEYTQTLIMHILIFLQFKNTDYTETGMPYYDKLYKIDFTKNNYKDMKVKAIYEPSWGMDFKALPSDNGVVKSFNFKAYNFIQTCIQLFHHRYNINYPVMFKVSINDKPGEEFYFATPVILKRNNPNRHGTVESWDSELEVIDNKKSYCQETEEVTRYDLGMDNQITTRKITAPKRNNELNIYAVDPLQGMPQGAIEGVDISYQCVEARCHIGTTKYQTYDGLVIPGSIPLLNSKFPDCLNGIIVAEKPGYHTALKTQTVSGETDGQQVNINMHKLKEFNYDVRVVQEHNGIISDRPMQDKESVLITIKNDEQRFQKSIVYPSEKGYLHNLTLMMGDFTYDLEILLTWENSLVGGASMEWEPSITELLNRESVLFYVYKKDPINPPKSSMDLYELFNQSLENSIEYPPRFT